MGAPSGKGNEGQGAARANEPAPNLPLTRRGPRDASRRATAPHPRRQAEAATCSGNMVRKCSDGTAGGAKDRKGTTVAFPSRRDPPPLSFPLALASQPSGFLVPAPSKRLSTPTRHLHLPQTDSSGSTRASSPTRRSVDPRPNRGDPTSLSASARPSSPTTALLRSPSLPLSHTSM